MLRYGGGVLHGLAIKQVQPVYPARAKQEGITGTVVVEVIIDQQGKVELARTVPGTNFRLPASSHPLLAEAALKVARQ